MFRRLVSPAAFCFAVLQPAIVTHCADTTESACVATEAGVAIAADMGDAGRYARALEDAARAFELHFGKAAPAAAAVEGARQANAAAAIDPESEVGAIALELCHFFLVEGFGLSAGRFGPGALHYGGAAPDWLDEAGAILCENEKLTTGRYDALKRVLDDEEGAQFWPLPVYLTMPHPLTMAAAQRSSDGGFTVSIRSGDDAKLAMRGPDGISAEFFYVQSRLFADYLQERSGDVEILGSIAREFSVGRSFASWLRRNGRANNLPRTIKALETDWEQWLVLRLALAEEQS